MDLKQLNTFVKVAELGSLSKASERLHIAQPALSRQIRMLEEELGTPLFMRHRRGMVINEAGKQLFGSANSVLKQVDDIRSDLTRHSDEIKGNVVVGVPPTVGDVLSSRIVNRFMSKYPMVRLRIVPAFTDHLLEWLQRGEIDIAIIYTNEKQKDLKTFPLIMEDLFLVGHRDAGLTSQKTVAFKDLVNMKLILPGPNHSLRQLIEREAAIAQIGLDVPVEADSLQTLKDLCRSGLGYTILPLAPIHEQVIAGELSIAPIVKPTLSRKLIVAQPLSRPSSNAVEKFAGELQMEVEEMVKSGVWGGRLLTR